MRETRSSGSVEGVMSNRDPYSDHKKSFVSPINHASRTIAIKPDVKGGKQLDNGIDDTFVSSVREEVSFALIDFQP